MLTHAFNGILPHIVSNEILEGQVFDHVFALGRWLVAICVRYLVAPLEDPLYMCQSVLVKESQAILHEEVIKDSSRFPLLRGCVSSGPASLNQGLPVKLFLSSYMCR